MGRGREVASLGRLLKAAPVVAVVGPPGVGKTALALAYAHGAGGAPLFVSVEATAAAEGAQRQLDEVLARAEASGATVILDGLEASVPERAAVLMALTRGARASRWIVTARELPPGPPPRVRLTALAPADARALALAVGAPEADLDWIVEDSLGAPGRVRRLAGADVGGPIALPDTARPWLVRLAAVTAPVPLETIRTDAEREAICAAAAAGLVSWSPAGFTLDPVVRADVRERLEHLSADEKRALADRFAAAGDEASWINAIDLWLQLGERDRVIALLDARGEALVDGPRVADLWTVLRAVTAPGFARWRFRVAVATGVVAEVDPDEVEGDDPAIRCDRARLLILRGKNEAARELADAILDELDDASSRIAFRAAMASTAASLNLRQGEPALEVLARVRPSTELERVSYDVVRAKALGIAGREGEGIAVLEDIRPLALRLLPVLPHPVMARLTGACIDLDQRALARHLLPDPVASAYSAFGPDVTHLVDVAHACIIALDDGRLADIAPFAELQETMPLADSLVSDHVRLIRAEWLVATGRLAEASRVIDAVGAVDRSDNAEWVAMLRAHIDLATGVPPEGASPATGGDAASTDEIARMRQALRWGGGPFAQLPSRTHEKPRTRRCLPLQLRAEHALFHGAVEDAAYDAGRACREAERYGYRVLLADALATRADIACVARDWPGCREAAEQLVATGRAIASPRWEGEGAFYLAALDRDWAWLERLAAAREPSPMAARRAAALLGDARGVDRLDERVIEAIRSRDAWPEVHVVGGEGEPWGVDLTAGRVWVDGAWVDVETHKVTWRVLEAIADAGGRADSRDLLRIVWDVREYKPHLHDNRLQITVHRLRGALGGDGDAPRIVREGEGYALGGRARLVRGSRPTS